MKWQGRRREGERGSRNYESPPWRYGWGGEGLDRKTLLFVDGGLCEGEVGCSTSGHRVQWNVDGEPRLQGGLSGIR